MTAWLLTYAINALWQAPLVFLVAWLAARLLRSFGPLTELRVWTVALGLQVLLPAVPAGAFTLLRAVFPHPGRSGFTGIATQQGPAIVHSGLSLSPAFAWTLTAGYLLYLLFRVARLVHALARTIRLRRNARPSTLNPAAARLWADCHKHFHLRLTKFAEVDSELLRTPVTLGLRMPCILFPAGLLDRLAPDDLRALFAHEAAHIARNDFARNLMVQVLALPIAFLPTTRVTLLRLAASREIVCDMLAAEAMPQPVGDGRGVYAHSLLRLAAALLSGEAGTIAQPFALGLFEASTLERRIMSLTHDVPRLSLLRRTLVLTATFTFGLGTCASAIALHATPLVPGAPASSPQPADPVHVGAGVMAGQVRSHVNPRYPQAAKDAGIQGTVLLHAIVGKDGVVDQLTVISAPPELRASALEAVHQWIYEPYLLNGEPTEVETTITINYTLAN